MQQRSYKIGTWRRGLYGKRLADDLERYFGMVVPSRPTWRRLGRSARNETRKALERRGRRLGGSGPSDRSRGERACDVIASARGMMPNE